MCIYIYIERERDIRVYISLSLYIYIYIYTYMYIHLYTNKAEDQLHSTRNDCSPACKRKQPSRAAAQRTDLCALPKSRHHGPL